MKNQLFFLNQKIEKKDKEFAQLQKRVTGSLEILLSNQKKLVQEINLLKAQLPGTTAHASDTGIITSEYSQSSPRQISGAVRATPVLNASNDLPEIGGFQASFLQQLMQSVSPSFPGLANVDTGSSAFPAESTLSSPDMDQSTKYP